MNHQVTLIYHWTYFLFQRDQFIYLHGIKTMSKESDMELRTESKE